MMSWIPFTFVCAVIGVLMLIVRDRMRAKRLVKQLQGRLRSKAGCSDSELMSVFPLQREKEIAVKFRTRLSKALRVEPEKIHADDDLHRDYKLNEVSPFFIAAVASELTRDPSKPGVQEIFRYKEDATKFKDFVRAISQQPGCL